MKTCESRLVSAQEESVLPKEGGVHLCGYVL